MNETAATIDLLERAKAELLERGMCKGHIIDYGTGAVCARGALAVVLLPAKLGGLYFVDDALADDSYRTADSALSTVARRLYPERRGSYMAPIVNFNNHPDTTLSELVEVFDAAIIHVKEEAR
jgi:hypothetical protein